MRKLRHRKRGELPVVRQHWLEADLAKPSFLILYLSCNNLFGFSRLWGLLVRCDHAGGCGCFCVASSVHEERLFSVSL